MGDAVDFVVIGAGTAGCVIASRLSENPEVTVMLLEAGPWPIDPRVHIPRAWPELLGGPYDWGYRTEPQAGLAGRVVEWPRGRVVGGTGAINAMVYVRGASFDFEMWAAWGGAQWGAEEVAGWYERIEASFLGRGGRVVLNPVERPHPLAIAFLESAQRCDLAVDADFNAGCRGGVNLYQLTCECGTRHHTAASYLAPALDRANLAVVDRCLVQRLRIDKGRVHAVDHVVDGQQRNVVVSREVIVCAGVVASPQLLMLSGIGPAEELRRHGITVNVDLPGVGQNLHDHVQISCSFGTVPFPLPDQGSNLGECGGFVRTRPGLPAPDVQLSFAPMKDLNHATAIGGGFTIGPAVTRPVSRGEILLRSADVVAPPRILPNYLAEWEDVETLVAGVLVADEIAATPPLADYRTDGTPGLEKRCRSRRDIVEFIRSHATTQFHPVGSCRFGTDELAVVDPELRVRGVMGLRVADASVMPQITTGNVQAPVIVVAERAAALAAGGA